MHCVCATVQNINKQNALIQVNEVIQLIVLILLSQMRARITKPQRVESAVTDQSKMRALGDNK